MYKDKHPRWWVQSYLAGISTLVLGGRDHNGHLHKVCIDVSGWSQSKADVKGDPLSDAYCGIL